MLKILHVLATGLETGIGIWIFSQTFEKRNRMGKRHIASEIMLYIWLVLGVYTFPAFYYKVSRWNWYVPTLIFISVLLLARCILYKIIEKQLGKRENNIIIKGLFVGAVLWISCQYWTSYQSYLFTLLGNTIPVLFIFCFYKCTFIQAYLWEFWYCTNLALLKMIYVTYIGTFQNQDFGKFFLSPRIHTYSEIFYSLTICFVIWIFVRNIQMEFVLKKVLGNKKKKFGAITVGEWLVLRKLIISGIEKVDKKNLTITLVLVVGFVVVLTFALARLIGKVEENEKKFLDSRNTTLEQQYQELNTAYERYRCLVHDEKHMIFYLKECLDNGDIYTAQKFLESYQVNTINGVSGFHTGIPTLDFILNIKKRKMDEIGTRFTFEIDMERIPMSDTDFVILIGNLMDNAIEAVEKCPIEKRIVHLVLRNINEMFFFKIKNSSVELPIVRNARFFTCKWQKEEHGWGIESVKHIVETYEGQISFKYDASFFEVSIIINE